MYEQQRWHCTLLVLCRISCNSQLPASWIFFKAFSLRMLSLGESSFEISFCSHVGNAVDSEISRLFDVLLRSSATPWSIRVRVPASDRQKTSNDPWFFCGLTMVFRHKKHNQTTKNHGQTKKTKSNDSDLWFFHFDAPNSVSLDSVTLCCWLWLWLWLCVVVHVGVLLWRCGVSIQNPRVSPFVTSPVYTFTTSPCVAAPRAHVFQHVHAVPVHTGTFWTCTRWRYEWTHGGREEGVIVSSA